MQALRWIATATLCFAAAATPSPGQTRPLYHGAAHLFSLDQVTVVYPARPGARGDVNRLSAQRRAEFLRVAHGMRVEVAADDAVAPEQLRGNLLLLGWDNRLLQAGDTPSPIVEAEGERRFLGEIRIAPGDDLLFGWGSPYDPRRYLVFWSRIDLELDRFLSLPFVGSDWAVYRDFYVLGQGQFAEKNVWPPERNPYGERPLSPPPVLGAGGGSAHYRLHHFSTLVGPAEAEEILAAREAAWAKAVDALGTPPEGFTIDLFVYRDQADMREKSGVHDMAMYSIPARRELHMTRRLAGLESPHEDLHVLARELLGPAPLSAMYEGLAVSLEQSEEESNLGMYAAAMVEQKRVPTIAELLDEERLRVLVREGVGLPAAGLFVRWLRANTDDDLFRRAYTLREGGAAALASLLEQETAAMEAAFASWFRGLAKAAQADYRHNKLLSEARIMGNAGDHDRELAALTRALEGRPDDPETLYLISLARLRAGEFPAAEETLRRLIAVTEDQKESAVHVLGVLRLGQALERQGKAGQALERFEELLALPDQDDSHRRAREAIERIGKGEAGD